MTMPAWNRQRQRLWERRQPRCSFAGLARHLVALLLACTFTTTATAADRAPLVDPDAAWARLLAEGNSEEVGIRTTNAVVQAIFLVIILDAVFAIFFSSVGWL